MATTAAKSAGGSKKNDGATILWAGNVPTTSRVTNAPGLSFMIRSGVGENVAAGPDTDATINAGTAKYGTYKPVSAGTFNAQRAGQYIIPLVTTLIAGVANTTLQSGAGDFGRNSINRIKDIRITYLYQFQWAQLGNNIGSGVTITATVKNTVNDTLGTDVAATPTRALPGQLVYIETGKTPTTSNYKARND